ncbi:MAG: malate synthase A, partial [Thermoplasmatota archaeon]
RYIAAWLDGQGAVAIHGLMEDAATAEISRSQLWQWIQHGVEVDGRALTGPLVAGLIDSHTRNLAAEFPNGRWDDAAKLLTDIVLANEFHPFLTLPAYAILETP